MMKIHIPHRVMDPYISIGKCHETYIVRCFLIVVSCDKTKYIFFLLYGVFKCCWHRICPWTWHWCIMVARVMILLYNQNNKLSLRTRLSKHSAIRFYYDQITSYRHRRRISCVWLSSMVGDKVLKRKLFSQQVFQTLAVK